MITGSCQETGKCLLFENLGKGFEHGYGRAIALPLPTQRNPCHVGRRGVSQPDLTQVSSAMESRPPERLRVTEPDASVPATVPLDPRTLLDPTRLLEELAQTRSLEQERTVRIHHLEQALDQALACMEELRLRVQDQGLIEAQLAATEKFASVQQQAIARLKMRLKQQQHLMDTQMAEARARNWATQERLKATEAVVKAQQEELETLRSRLAGNAFDALRLDGQGRRLRSNADSTQQRMTELEAESERAKALTLRLQILLEAAQQRIQELALTLSDYQSRPIAPTPPPSHQLTLDSVMQAELPSHSKPLDRRTQAIATLGQDLARAQIKVEELEIELARQLRTQARWQQSYREMEAECDRHRARIASLEHQGAEMQEQIFQNVRQTNEYEAAVQHWRDQYVIGQRQLAQLKELLDSAQVQILASEQVDPELTAVFSELMTMIELVATTELSSLHPPAPASPTRFNSLDLPDFLLRRRTQRRGRMKDDG